jgi:hypothetical protein
MGKLWVITFNKFNVKRVDFNVKFEITSGLDGQQSLLWLERSDIPRIIWEIKSFLLHISNWSKLSGAESELSF